jgi:hypothetical protein
MSDLWIRVVAAAVEVGRDRRQDRLRIRDPECHRRNAVASEPHSPAFKHTAADAWTIAEELNGATTGRHAYIEASTAQTGRADRAGGVDDPDPVGADAAEMRAADDGAAHLAMPGRVSAAELEPSRDCGEHDWPRTELRTRDRPVCASPGYDRTKRVVTGNHEGRDECHQARDKKAGAGHVATLRRNALIVRGSAK